MKTNEGNYVMCIFTGKICYTEREAGIVINGCKRHVHMGNGHWAKAAHGNSTPQVLLQRLRILSRNTPCSIRF